MYKDKNMHSNIIIIYTEIKYIRKTQTTLLLYTKLSKKPRKKLRHYLAENIFCINQLLL